MQLCKHCILILTIIIFISVNISIQVSNVELDTAISNILNLRLDAALMKVASEPAFANMQVLYRYRTEGNLSELEFDVLIFFVGIIGDEEKIIMASYISRD